jgi:hypothetical protein
MVTIMLHKIAYTHMYICLYIHICICMCIHAAYIYIYIYIYIYVSYYLRPRDASCLCDLLNGYKPGIKFLTILAIVMHPEVLDSNLDTTI